MSPTVKTRALYLAVRTPHPLDAAAGPERVEAVEGTPELVGDPLQRRADPALVSDLLGCVHPRLAIEPWSLLVATGVLAPT